MVIVNSQEKWDTLQKVMNQHHFIYLQILSDANKHPKDNRVSCFYIRTALREYIVPVNHNEKFGMVNDIEVNRNLFIADLKSYQHNTMVKSDKVIDLNWNHYIETNEPYDIDKNLTNAHHWYYRTHYDKDNINDVIPLVKHAEYLKKISDDFVPYLNSEYDQTILEVLSDVEKSGIQTTDGLVYSEYNPYTSTGRPSNRFGGLNFAALNKKDGSRKPFVSRFKNGVLVEMDFDAYHLRLIADKIGYEFPQGSVHEHMAKFYNVSYEEAKTLSFQYLYGFIPHDVVQMNPYFSKVYDYIEELYNDFKSKEFIVSDIYNRQLHKKNLGDMNANKLFNYTIQLMETENNMKALTRLIPEIKEYKSKLILYSYDSFLLDFNMEDGLDYLKKVKQILEQDGKYPVKVSWGLNYHEMKDITEKFI